MKTGIRGLLISGIAALLAACATGSKLTGPGSVKKFINTDSVLGKGLTGIEVYDPATRRVIFHYNNQRYFTPASNTKLLTFYTAERILGDSLPALHYCSANDTLFFSGTGDPTLLNPEFPKQPVFDFLKNSRDTLVFIPSFSKERRFGPGWSWDDYPYYYSPEKSTLPVYGNVVSFKYAAGDSVVHISPPEFTDSVTIIEDTTVLNTDERIFRSEFSNRFIISLDASDSLDELVPFTLSKNLAIRLLEDTLGRKITDLPDQPYCVWKTAFNQPVDSVMKVMLYKSDNFLAEQILTVCSSVLSDTLGTERVIEYALDSIIPDLKDKMVWVDGSGLSRYNLQKPDNFVKILERIYNEFPHNKIFDLLPGYGYDLSRQLDDGDPGIHLYAKSGSMTHVYNMSGYIITRRNRLLIFSLMNNNFGGSVSSARKQSQKILQWIHEKY